MKTSEILNKAADLIEERGWVTGGRGWWMGEADTSELCIEGGLQAALGLSWAPSTTETFEESEERLDNFNLCPAYKAVKEYLEWKTSLYWWNDHKAGSKEHVIEVLRATALVEAAKEDALEEAMV